MAEQQRRKFSNAEIIDAVENSVNLSLVAMMIGGGVEFRPGTLTVEDISRLYRMAIIVICGMADHLKMSDSDMAAMFSGLRAAERIGKQ